MSMTGTEWLLRAVPLKLRADSALAAYLGRDTENAVRVYNAPAPEADVIGSWRYLVYSIVATPRPLWTFDDTAVREWTLQLTACDRMKQGVLTMMQYVATVFRTPYYATLDDATLTDFSTISLMPDGEVRQPEQIVGGQDDRYWSATWDWIVQAG